MFEFAYPWVLLLLLIVVLLYFYEVYYKRRPSIIVPHVGAFSKVIKKRRASISQWLMFIAIILLVIALARPRFGDEKVVIRSQGIDIIIALDLSGSMQAIDVPKNITNATQLQSGLKSGEIKNRLEVAKEEISNFINKRPNDRIGLIGFAPLPYNFAPPTLDHSWLLLHLKQLFPGIIGDATGLAGPIASGIERLKSSNAPKKVLVLFTDGRNNVDSRLTPQQTADLAKEFNVIIHTVGIGSNNAYIQDNSFGRSSFQPIRDEFDEELLKSIAKVSGGQYFKATDANGMREVMKKINKLEKTTIEQPKYMQYKELAPNIAILALVLLILSFIIDNTWKLRLP